MTFQPFVPTGGLSGWRFLQRTIETQRVAHAQSPLQDRDIAYFKAKIGSVDTAAELVADYRLLAVALGAFGLQDDVGSKFLIRRVLEEGTIEPGALANKLSDKRYRDLSKAFGFGDFAVPSSKLSDFPEKIAARYAAQRFETDIGRSSETMRLALNAQRELPALAAGKGSNRTKWFTLMGTPPLRKVLETAFSLPTAFGTLPIDRQLDTFLERSRSTFGTDQLSEIGTGPKLSRLLDRFTALDGIGGLGSGGAGPTVTSPALMLLRGY